MKQMHQWVALQSFFVLMYNVSEWTSWCVTWLSVSRCLSPFWFTSPTTLPLTLLDIFHFIGSLPACLPPASPPSLYLSSTSSLCTTLPPYFHPPLRLTRPVISIKPQFGTVMGICTFDTNSDAICAIEGDLVLFMCNICHSSLSVEHRQCNASIADGQSKLNVLPTTMVFLVPRQNTQIDNV